MHACLAQISADTDSWPAVRITIVARSRGADLCMSKLKNGDSVRAFGATQVPSAGPSWMIMISLNPGVEVSQSQNILAGVALLIQCGSGCARLNLVDVGFVCVLR